MMKPLITLVFTFCSYITFAQNGTYKRTNKNGSSCTISINESGRKIKGEVFALWNTESSRSGSFTGKGTKIGNTCILKNEDDRDCQLFLTFVNGKIDAKFEDCMSSNLPEDFSGTYQKITDHLPGIYSIGADKASFHKSANAASKLKTYLIKGNRVEVTIENIINNQWVFVNYTNSSGKITSGYLSWSSLKN